MAWILLWLTASTPSRFNRDLWNLFILKSRERNNFSKGDCSVCFMHLVQESMAHVLSHSRDSAAISFSWESSMPVLGKHSLAGQGSTACSLRQWEKGGKSKARCVWIWTLQGSQTWRAVSPVGQAQKVLELHLRAEAIKSEQGERGRCLCWSLAWSSTGPCPWGSRAASSPAWRASLGRHWAALLGLERFVWEQKTLKSWRKTKMKHYLLIKRAEAAFMFVFISADARSFLILMCVSSPIPTDAGTVRTHLRLPDRFLVWFCKVSWESGDISCFAAWQKPTSAWVLGALTNRSARERLPRDTDWGSAQLLCWPLAQTLRFLVAPQGLGCASDVLELQGQCGLSLPAPVANSSQSLPQGTLCAHNDAERTGGGSWLCQMFPWGWWV